MVSQPGVSAAGAGDSSHPARPPSLWKHADFRRLWAGESVSQFGSTISALALPLTAILYLHASTVEVGLLTAAETTAFLLVGLPAGAWVDRIRVARVMIANDVVRLLALGSVPVAAAAGLLTMAQLYAVALVTGVATVFFDVAYMSYLPQLVPRANLVEGNAKLQASESVAQLAGPSAGGFLVQGLGAPYALALDALSFAWSAAWVARVRTRPVPSPRPEHPRLGREILEGLRFVFGHPLLRAIAACTSSSNLFSAVSQAVIYVLLARLLRLSPGVIGLLISAGAIGGLVAAAIASRLAERFGQGRIIWMSIALTIPFPFIAPFLERNWTLLLYGVGQAIWAGGVIVYNVTQVSFRQALCPPALLGRMNATMRFVVWGTMPLGALLGGILGSVLGVRATLLVAAAGASLAVVPLWLSPLPGMRTLPSLQEEPGAAAPGPPELLLPGDMMQP